MSFAEPNLPALIGEIDELVALAVVAPDRQE